MHSVRDSNYHSRKDPNSNDHGLGKILWGVPPENKDQKGVDGDSLGLVREKIFREEKWQKTHQRSIKKV